VKVFRNEGKMYGSAVKSCWKRGTNPLKRPGKKNQGVSLLKNKQTGRRGIGKPQKQSQNCKENATGEAKRRGTL